MLDWCVSVVERDEDVTTPVFGDGELDKGFVDEKETIGYGHTSCELNASFTLRVSRPSVSGSECGRGQDEDLEGDTLQKDDGDECRFQATVLVPSAVAFSRFVNCGFGPAVSCDDA
ncbi:hypothetical protein M378DRAFT_174183 [Amanita muscaria Koide BX008]|uniref:Uncharacterized protein n=1 Tax=Amanita muscaria (strain Koide BX008) TaxID=946122 RepID=A0A0C2WEN5_AMAMK|nr:hypothetical protein M378DRAFT_174183 [Amanita muscaria Koide BX008]